MTARCTPLGLGPYPGVGQMACDASCLMPVKGLVCAMACVRPPCIPYAPPELPVLYCTVATSQLGSTRLAVEAGIEGTMSVGSRALQAPLAPCLCVPQPQNPGHGWRPTPVQVVVENVPVRRGLLLLEPSNCALLGGQVSERGGGGGERQLPTHIGTALSSGTRLNACIVRASIDPVLNATCKRPWIGIAVQVDRLEQARQKALACWNKPASASFASRPGPARPTSAAPLQCPCQGRHRTACRGCAGMSACMFLRCALVLVSYLCSC